MKRPAKIFAAATILACMAFTAPVADTSRKLHVVIDVAHGGKDNGASYGAWHEKDIVREIAAQLEKHHNNEEIVLHFTRNGDNFVSLEERVKYINSVKPDLVISMHANFAKDATLRGSEVFYANEAYRPESKVRAVALAGKLTQHKIAVRNVAEAPFFVLKKSEAAAVHLELGFLSNEADRQMLTTPEGQQALATLVDTYINEIK